MPQHVIHIDCDMPLKAAHIVCHNSKFSAHCQTIKIIAALKLCLVRLVKDQRQKLCLINIYMNTK